MNFENQIKQWIQADNELKELAGKTKTLREKKNALETSLTNYATEHHLSNNIIKCQDARLKFANTKVTEPLTFRYLEERLNEIIPNADQVKKIMTYIKENREVKIVSEIKRFSNN